LRINDRIRVREVRLINAAGEQVGIVPTFKALEAAVESGLDLVEVSPEARPPVCKIMDYGKYKYSSDKKEKEARKKAHVVITKEIKIRPKIDKHDLEVKLRHIKEFLDEGNKVRLAIVFRGREMAHQEFGRDLMERCLKDLEDKALVEQYPKMEGNYFGALLGPKAGGAKPKPAAEKPVEKPAPEKAAKPAAPAAK
jgi:translation initiation factor IF-3